MKFSLKPVEEQTILITGASSGIGLATAREAAVRGARVVLLARNEPAIRREVDQIESEGGEAIAIAADVTDKEALGSAVNAAIGEFGVIDTWVNNAGVSVYGRIEDLPESDARRIFETNFWGLVHGSMTAVRHWKHHLDAQARTGFTLVNIGSVLSDRAIPLQGMYCASKHAVKGFTDALRMELEEDELPINVSLVKPGSIDTPYAKHAKNLTDQEPTLPPPVYHPDLVADAILFCAENHRRDLIVGGGGRVLSAMSRMPRAADRYMENNMTDAQLAGRPAGRRTSNLYAAGEGGDVQGGYSGWTRKHSATTSAAKHPAMATAIGVAAGGIAALGFAALLKAGQRSGDESNDSTVDANKELAKRGTPLENDYRARVDSHATEVKSPVPSDTVAVPGSQTLSPDSQKAAEPSSRILP